MLFCYGLNRYSEDLDFDCAKRLNPKACIVDGVKDLNLTLKNSAQKVSLLSIDNPKDTETTSRYMIRYSFLSGSEEVFLDSLKLEISHRNELVTTKNYDSFVNHETLYNGYKLEHLLEHKLICIGAYPQKSLGRSKIRDLYDAAFISQHYQETFTQEQCRALSSLCSNLDKLSSQFKTSYAEDKVVKNMVELDELILTLAENAQRLMDRWEQGSQIER